MPPGELFLIIFLFKSSQENIEFLSFPTTVSSKEVCCDESLLSCTEVKFDPSILYKENMTLKGIFLTKMDDDELESSGFYFTSTQGDEAHFSYNEETKSTFGSLKTWDGRSYAIEKCQYGHVWKEFNVSSFIDDVQVEKEESIITEEEEPPMVHHFLNFWTVTIDVMVYYTPDFAEHTPDVDDFIDKVIKETNRGYINSKIPLRVKLFCKELATINDQVLSNNILY